MNQPLPNLSVRISKTADGQNDYLQILTNDQFSVNVVLIAATITVHDLRPGPLEPGTLRYRKPKKKT